MRFGLTSSAWSKQASRSFRTDTAHPKPMDHRHMTMCKFLGCYDELSLRSDLFTTSLPRDRALAILIEIDEAERMMWTERVRGPKASMIIHQIMMGQAHVWV